jgi:DNA replication protein DnaC
MTDNNITLSFLLKELKLSLMAKNWQSKSEEAHKKSLSYADFLAILCEEEIANRYHARTLRLIRESKLPITKTLTNFDFNNAKNINKQQINHLANDSSWIKNNENLLIFGPSGVGKTHLAAAIANSLIVKKSIRVKFISTVTLIQHLQKAKQVFSLIDELSKLDKYQLLILDDIGYVKKTSNEAEVLFELISHRYESGSMIITANQPFSEWNKIFEDNMMTVAAIDRLIHHATIIECNEESFRKKESLQKKQNLLKVKGNINGDIDYKNDGNDSGNNEVIGESVGLKKFG